MESTRIICAYLKDVLSWEEAHLNFEAAVHDLPKKYRGMKPEGFPYSIWQLVEHIRIAQRDILDFSRSPDYEARNWPDDFWPKDPSPGSDEEWEQSITAVRNDRQEFIKLLDDAEIDIFKPFEHGTGQTLFRQALLIADHTAYHLGQIVVLRKIFQHTL